MRSQPGYDAVQQGVSLALDAHRRGFVGDRELDALLAYYDNEGAVDPFPAAEVLTKIGGVTAEQLRELFGRGPARAPSEVQGQRFGDRLTLLEPIGEGGMGTVFRAYDRVLKRAVAVKRMRVDSMDAGAGARALARFEREAMAMARVRHPACVQIFDAGLTKEGEPYLVMEFVAGKSLRAVIEEHHAPGGRGPIDPRQVATWGAAVAEALQACHDVGLVHRDVKPANVLLDAQRQPRLTDFGVALDDKARTKLTMEKSMVGTLAYMAPEQALGAATVDARSDVYALGATLYELLTGRPPLDASSALILLRQVVSVEPTPVRKVAPRVPVDLETVVMKCLNKAADDRYATAQALALDLRRFLADEPVLARPTSAGQRVARRLWRARRVVGAVGVLALGSVAVAGIARVRAREAERARIDAALAAAAVTSDIDAAEQEVMPLVAIAEPEQAERAREALRVLRGRRRLKEAEAAFERWKVATARAKALLEEADALKERIDPQQPYAESGDKKRLLGLKDEQAAEEERAAEALFEAERALAQAALDLPTAEPNRIRARLLVMRARAIEETDPAAAEKHFQHAELLAGSDADLAADLARPTVTVTSVPSGQYVLYVYQFDGARGRMLPSEVARADEPGATLVGRGAGDYLLEVLADDCLPARYLLQLTRGDQRRVDARLINRHSLGPLADLVVHVPAGDTRWGERLEEQAATEDVLLFEDEVSYELYWSYLVAKGRTAELLHIGLPKETPPSRELRRRWPAMRLKVEEIAWFVQWFEIEAQLAGVASVVRLPTLAEWARAVRGELSWPTPWGRHLDASFSLNGVGIADVDPTDRLLAPDSNREDVAAVRARNLAGRLAEVVVDPRDGSLCFIGGAFSTSSEERTLSAMLVPRRSPQGIRLGDGGFRVAVPVSGVLGSVAKRRVRDTGEPWSAEHLKTKDLSEQQRLLTQALSKSPLEPTLWNLRGVVRCKRDDYWGGVWDFSVALCLKHDDPVVLANRAGAHFMRGALEDAERDVVRAIELRPNDIESWIIRLSIYLESGDLVRARSALERAEALDPGHPDVAAARQRLGR